MARTRERRVGTWDAICTRRNVRQYKPEPVSEDDLHRIAEAGMPLTHGNAATIERLTDVSWRVWLSYPMP